MARTDPQVNFRIPAELKTKLEQAARDNGRSITNELVARLDESFIVRKSEISRLGTPQMLHDAFVAALREQGVSVEIIEAAVETASKRLYETAKMLQESLRDLAKSVAVSETGETLLEKMSKEAPGEAERIRKLLDL